MSKLKVLLVDDEEQFVETLADRLEMRDMEAGAVFNGEQALDAVKKEEPDVIVLDVKMPGLNGLELQNQLQKREYSIPIVFVTGHGDIPMSVKAMKTGAIDFLTKPFDEEDLLKAVQEALENDIANRSEMNERQNILHRAKSLTPREYEILTYVITGMLNKQIAYALNISEKTVKVHRGRVMEKLDMDSVAELVRLAEKAGIQPADISEL